MLHDQYCLLDTPLEIHMRHEHSKVSKNSCKNCLNVLDFLYHSNMIHHGIIFHITAWRLRGSVKGKLLSDVRDNMDGVSGWSSVGENFILEHGLSLSRRGGGGRNHNLRRPGLIKTFIFKMQSMRPGHPGTGLCEITAPTFLSLDILCSWW